MGGLAPDWGQGAEVLAHCVGTRHGCVCLGNVTLAPFDGSCSWGGDLDPGMT
jgi:hypothetical protein